MWSKRNRSSSRSDDGNDRSTVERTDRLPDARTQSYPSERTVENWLSSRTVAGVATRSNVFIQVRGLPHRRSDVDTTTTDTVELWVRSFETVTTGGRRERAIERVERLETSSAVETATVAAWGRAIEESDRLEGVPQLRAVRRRLEAFDEWADRTDRELTPFFRRNRAESAITDRSTVVRRLPVLALAEFDGDELLHVAPCREGERTIDVFDRLAALEAEGVVTFDGDRRPRESGNTRPKRERTDDRPRLGPQR